MCGLHIELERIYMKSVLLICPAAPNDMPYLRPYIDCLESYNIAYDVIYISWDNEKNTFTKNYYMFDGSWSFKFNSSIEKIYKYYKFSRVVIKKLSKGRYTHVITMGIACSIFLSNFLKRNFCGKYIYDIRDYSQVLRSSLCSYLNKELLRHSYINVISSNGFKKWLPNNSNIEYIMCHNTTLDKVAVTNDDIDMSKPLKILTIGQIRDLEANTYVIEQLSNNDNYELVFAGKGKTLECLQRVAEDKGYKNIKFLGKYNKENEDSIVESATFINVCMGHDMISDFLLSNRLYLAARMKKPLISFDGCYQADIINKYNLGLVVKRDDLLPVKLQEYIHSFNADRFVVGCTDFLMEVQDELRIYHNKLDSFLRISSNLNVK